MKNSLKKVILPLLSIVILISLAGCKAEEEPVKVDVKSKTSFDYFDTVSVIFDYANDSAERFETLSADVFYILDEYHKLFDIYYEYTDINNICTINRFAGKEKVTVDPKIIEFLNFCKELYYLTDGYTDVMMGSVLKIWHHARTAGDYVPEYEELLEASNHCGFEYLEIDEENNTVYITDPKASLDVGAIGKGYATEKAAQYLIEQNALSYVLNIGGNIRAIGTKIDGSSWSTGIRNPKAHGEYLQTVSIADTSCVTSGNYERYYVYDGVKYHHIIDKDTLYPADYFASITIITEDSGMADALSTALFCMSREDGLKLIEKIGDISVVWIDSENNVYLTEDLMK